mmetsp:Transcript_7366/g.18807  ORF Transcript_7366/g.18807 Transcript_7366/m.18807 type:complete len:302 (-) Transcript_7366:167-1072(-)
MQRDLLQPPGCMELLQPLEDAVGGLGLPARSRDVVAEPAILEGLLGSAPMRRGSREQAAYHPLGMPGDPLNGGQVEADTRLAHHAEDLCVRVAVEGRRAAEHYVHDHPGAPRVAGLRVQPVEDLRVDVAGRPHLAGQELARSESSRIAEVNDLELVALHRRVVLEHEVLGLDITVAHTHVVHVRDGAKKLLHGHCCLHLRKLPRLYHALKELAAAAQLHDEVEALWPLPYLVQLHDVRVVHAGEDVDLVPGGLHELLARLCDHLDRTLHLRQLVRRLAHAAERAVADGVVRQRVRDIDGSA